MAQTAGIVVSYKLKEFEEFNIDVKYLSGYSSVAVFAGHLPSDSDSSSLVSNEKVFTPKLK